MEITLSSTDETKKLAHKIAKKLKSKDVIALRGDLGAGKTTFTSFLVKALGIEARVQSPTFVLARKYMKKNNNSKMSGDNPNNTQINVVNHIDLYRILNENEVQNLDLQEMFDEKNAITVIEWPEIAKNILPKRTIRIWFSDLNRDKRKVKIDSCWQASISI